MIIRCAFSIFFVLFIQVILFAQNDFIRTNTEDPDQIIYCINILSEDGTARLTSGNILSGDKDIAYFRIDTRSRKCYFVASKGYDLHSLSTALEEQNISYQFSMRMKLNNKNYLSIYTDNRKAPVIQDTGQPEKDRHNYKVALSAWSELQESK